MKRVVVYSLLLVLGFLISEMMPSFPDEPIPVVFAKAASEMRQAGVAAKLYADDHAGFLPARLDELAPKYLADNKLLLRLQLATPTARLAELPPESIVLFCVVTEEHRHRTRLFVMHPDLSVEGKRQ